MSRRRKLSIVALTGSLFLTSAAGLHAQSDAELALQNARKAYQADDYELARDLARQASQTDAKNPDVWLLLGKAHYQLGELDQTLGAWRALLRLAPDHEYARRMVTALEGQATEVDVRIRHAQMLVDEGLVSTGRNELASLRARVSLSAEQRKSVLLLSAEIELLDGKGTDALAVVSELTSRQPEAAALVSVRMLTARSQLAIGGTFTTLGLQELQKISEDAKDAADGQVARLELLLYRLTYGADVVADVAAWIEQNGSLSAARRARIALRESVNSFLAASRPPIGPKPDAELNDNDKAALAAAAHAVKAFVNPADQVALANTLTDHFEKTYLVIRAYSAAQNGLKLVRELALPKSADVVLAASQKRIDEAEAHYEYDQINRDMGEAIVSPDVMAKWISENIGHPKELEARQSLVFAYLNVTRRQA
ncbi:MAG: tetratricopeptide repeat protein, partial [Planctomycetota bacterium]|nr:tetratricopeptide repeat protein [Planctomycetota bacterium]